jgi:hypothetical protein
MWWAGEPAGPARFVTAALPLLGPAIAVAWQGTSRLGRAQLATLLAVSVAISAIVIGAASGRLAWNIVNSRSNFLQFLGSCIDIARVWPSFFWSLTPGVVRSEAPFATHVLAWCALWAGSAYIMNRYCRPRDRVAAALAACLWGLLAASAAPIVGSLATGAPILRPEQQQFGVARYLAGGHRAIRIVPMSIGRVDLEHAQMSVAAGSARMGWLPLFDVAPGRYEVRVTARRPASGQLDVRLSGSRGLLRRFDLKSTSTQSFNLGLPAGARALVFEPDAATRANAVVEVVPAAPAATEFGGSELATGHFVQSGIDVFTFGHDAFVEPDGFWTHGRATVPLLVSAPRDRAYADLEMVNGPLANVVTVDRGREAEDISLAPSARTRVRIKLDGAGTALVSVRSHQEFRPAHYSGDDWRRLGVWVVVGK